MASVTDVCNDALGQLGGLRIDAIDDGTHQANLCLTFYDNLRRSALRDHKWNFATRWLELARDTATPPRKWTYQYTLPAEALRVWGIDEDGLLAFEVIQGADGLKKLATDETAVIAEITFDVTNPDQWDGMFFQGMTVLLAWKVAPSLIGGDSGIKMASEKLKEGQALMLDAKAADGQEESIVVLQSTSLTTDIRNG